MKIHLIPAIASACASILVLGAVVYAHIVAVNDQNLKTRIHAQERLSQVAATLSQSINKRINTTRSLAAFVKVNRNFTQEEFNIFATSLQSGLTGLRSLQLAPKGIITYVTGLKNNRSILGHDLFANPKRRHIVLRSIKDRKLIIAGPINLLQGGRALIARQPLFLPNLKTGLEEFWGFATALIEVNALLSDAGYFELEKEYTLAIRGTDGLGARGSVFHGDKKTFDHTIVTTDVKLPTGTWQISAALKPDHQVGVADSILFCIISGILVLFVGASIYIIIKQPITLKKAVEQATADLRVAKEEAEAASQAKSEFLSAMSHELRTPLNAVLGFTQMLEFNKKDPLSASQQSYTNHIKVSGQHLLSLIESVLDLAKIEAGETQITSESVQPNDIIEECISMVKSMAQDRGIAISHYKQAIQTPPIWVDRTRLKQVILNLLSNAIKYNRLDGRVDIETSIPNEKMIRISISDTGVGIPIEHQDELFLPFNRLGADRSEIQGTGIGLTITKKLVNLMNGKIDFKSEPGLGSSFWIELPQTESAASGQITQDAMDRHQQISNVIALPTAKNILLYIDDNPADLALMEEIVAQIDHLEMISAHNVEFGLEIAKHQCPDLIILDINLPGTNELEFLNILHAQPNTASIPTIAISANINKPDIQKILKTGFRFYLSKPIDVHKVIMMIKNVMLLKTMEQEEKIPLNN